jgi:AraC family cel operon transcriptional repressor
LHTHAFAEVFWCEAGCGRHHVNGQELPIATGDMVLVRGADRHALLPGADGLTLVNLSFPVPAVATLAAHLGTDWPWGEGPLPRHLRLTPRVMERLHTWTAELSAPGAGALARDAFLVDLARLVARQPGGTGAAVPPWLDDALEVFTDPRHLSAGIPGLARLCGRSVAHLNRTVRRHLGLTTTELVLRLRLDRAAAELRLSSATVADIADRCGLGHLGHFHRCFRRRFGTTPRRYRVDAWGRHGRGREGGTGG